MATTPKLWALITPAPALCKAPSTPAACTGSAACQARPRIMSTASWEFSGDKLHLLREKYGKMSARRKIFNFSSCSQFAIFFSRQMELGSGHAIGNDGEG